MWKKGSDGTWIESASHGHHGGGRRRVWIRDCMQKRTRPQQQPRSKRGKVQ